MSNGQGLTVAIDVLGRVLGQSEYDKAQLAEQYEQLAAQNAQLQEKRAVDGKAVTSNEMLANLEADPLEVYGEDGRTLLAIHRDGSVEGEIEHASEAGRLFIEAMRITLNGTVWVPSDASRATSQDNNPPTNS